MREILFRGKRCKDGEWVVGSYYKQMEFYGTPFESHVIITSTDDLEYDQALEFHCVQPETVGQFTGLTDKNGKKIFEGDVVKATIIRDEGYTERIRNVKGVIAFDSLGMIGLMTDRTYDNTPVWSDFFCELSISGCIIDYCFEVIGNIHDNPELLEG